MMFGRKRKIPWKAPYTPWKRERHCRDEEFRKENCYRRFARYPQNASLDIYTKRTALKASPSVVSLECFSGGEKISQGSGTIIRSSPTRTIILTAASLLSLGGNQNKNKNKIIPNSVAPDIKIIVYISDGSSFNAQIKAYDFHYNLAALKIQSGNPLPIASLARLQDSIPVDPDQQDISFQLRPHSTSFHLVPGDPLIALGRYIKPYHIMAAPGVFSINRCKDDCKELWAASCRITKCGIGGPLINRYGQVIGVCLHANIPSRFLPINIASIWWKNYKKCRKPRRPWLWMEVTNLYAAPVHVTERIIRNFPDVSEGVIVEEVVPGSPAESAGIKQEDVIIQFGGKRIRSSLELFKNAWNKVGETVELVVVRARNDAPLHLSMMVDEATS